MQINLNGLQINDEQLEIMFNRIKEKDVVIELNLSENNFTKLSNSISEFTNLKTLYLTFCTNLKDLGKLKKVNGNLSLNFCFNLKSLGDLEKVSGYLILSNCENLKDLGNLKKVDEEIWLKGTGITEEYIREFKPWLLDKCKWE